MTDEKQSWERLRSVVSEGSRGGSPIERRVANLEANHIDLVRELGQISAAWQAIANDIKTYVTRHEFDSVRYMVYGMVLSLVAGVIGAVISRGWFR